MSSGKHKILFLSNSPQIGGAQNTLLLLLQNLNRDMFTPLVVLPGQGPLEHRLNELGIKPIVFPLKRWIVGAALFNSTYLQSLLSELHLRVREISHLIEREGIDLVHTNTAVVLEGALAARVSQTPHLWHLHEILQSHPSFHYYVSLGHIYRIIDHLSARVVAVSKAVHSEAVSFVEPENVEVIHNGVDLRRFANRPPGTPNTIRRELGIDDSSPVIGSIGAILPEKGYRYLIEAAPRILKAFPSMRFVVAGTVYDRDLYESLRKRLKSLGIEQSFHFLGFRADIPELMHSLDLLVVPSLVEAFPTVILEAMAAGKPAVATRCGGTQEIIVEGETGLTVPPRDGHDLAAAIIKLVSDKALLQAMGRAGKKRVDGCFDGDVFAKKFEKLYMEILSSEKADTVAHGAGSWGAELLLDLSEKLASPQERGEAANVNLARRMTGLLKSLVGAK